MGADRQRGLPTRGAGGPRGAGRVITRFDPDEISAREWWDEYDRRGAYYPNRPDTMQDIPYDDAVALGVIEGDQ
mgnify:CR=1 FL=1|jgi:hypothetical protein